MPFIGEWRSFDYAGRVGPLARALGGAPGAFVLESGLRSAGQGRYSFLGCHPFAVFRGQGASTLDDLRRFWARHQQREALPFSPLGAGLVGYLAYELGLALENIPRTRQDDPCLPDAVFGFYDATLTLDHHLRKLHVFSSGLPERNPTLRRTRARERLKVLVNKLAEAERHPPRRETAAPAAAEFTDDFPRGDYLAAVKKVQALISAGDIYQANLSRRMTLGSAPASPVTSSDLYRARTRRSPAPFAGYFDAGETQLISSSPERFVQVRGGHVQTRPMKGTRPRGSTSGQDSRRAKELLASSKDRAELLMITDLMRNDLGRVCRYGSVAVKHLRTLERYRDVFQTTSTVEGDLAPGRDGFDLLRAVFPGGSITGCPKIRAMQVIGDLEPVPRFAYTGALGYIAVNGDMDFNILIRTMVRRGDRIHVHAGGGVVADSSPASEYAETRVKAQAMLECLAEFFQWGRGKAGQR